MHVPGHTSCFLQQGWQPSFLPTRHNEGVTDSGIFHSQGREPAVLTPSPPLSNRSHRAYSRCCPGLDHRTQTFPRVTISHQGAKAEGARLAPAPAGGGAVSCRISSPPPITPTGVEMGRVQGKEHCWPPLEVG